MQRQVVPVKRKDLFKLLGLNDPLDIVDPTEVKLHHFRAIRQFSPATERGAARIALHFEPNLGEDLCCPTVIQSEAAYQLASVSGG